MFIIQEIQYNNGSVALLPAEVKDTQYEAESVYHLKMSYAAASNVEVHSVIMYTEEGFEVMHGCYKHTPAPVEVAEETVE